MSKNKLPIVIVAVHAENEMKIIVSFVSIESKKDFFLPFIGR